MRVVDLQQWRAPLRGMDLRFQAGAESPEILLNIQHSDDGTWESRPGTRRHSGEVYGVDAPGRLMGTHVMRVDDQWGIVSIRARETTAALVGYVHLLIHDQAGTTKASFFLGGASGELPTTRHYYSFLQYGRFLFFCNGYGMFWEMEWEAGTSAQLKAIPLEAGFAPNALSYLTGNLFPSHVAAFYGQMVISGFKLRRECPISNPVAESQNVIAEELLSLSRDSMTIAPTDVLISEQGLVRSFPVEDASGFFRFWHDEATIATHGIGQVLYVFTRRGVKAIQGLGSQTPQEVWVSDQVLVSNRAICSLGGGAFFVSLEGAHVLLPGGQVQKISYEMDALWFHRRRPALTRYVSNGLKLVAGYPFWPNRHRLDQTCVWNDRKRKNIYVALPGRVGCPNFNWVFNYFGMESGDGIGKWSIWCGRLDSALGTRWTCFASDPVDGMVYIGTDNDTIVTLEDGRLDVEQDGSRNVTEHGFPVVVGLGRIGRVQAAGRGAYRAVRVRRRQVWRNVEDDGTLPHVSVHSRTEGESPRYNDTNKTDWAEAQAILPNMQRAPSKEATTIYGQPNWGATAPWMGTDDYHDFFVQPFMEGEENRSVVVDLYAPANDNQPHKLEIEEVALLGDVHEGAEVQS